MLCYLFIIFNTFVLAILSIDRNIKKIAILWSSIVLFTILTFFAGTRLIGYDYDNYLNHFNGCSNLFYYSRYVSSMEIGYELFVSFFKVFSSSFHLFLITFTGLSILILIKLFYKYSPYPLLSFLMFFSYSFFIQIMGQMRQPIAIAIAYLFLIPLIVRNKKIIALFLIIFTAIVLHKSLFFLLFGLIVGDKVLKKKEIIYLICISFGFYISSAILIDILPKIIPQNFYLYDAAMTYLVYKSHTLSFTMGMIERFLMCIIIWYYVNKYNLYNIKILRIFVNFYFIATCLYFTTISVSVEFASRGTQVLNYSLFFILPIIYNNVKLKDKKVLLIIILVWSIYLSMTFTRDLDIFLPYKSFILQ